MKTDIERVIRSAYRWGRDNGERRSEKNLADFFDTTLVKDVLTKAENLPISGVSVSFEEALKLMRDLAEHQNGAPLIRHEEEYNKTMTNVWDFLEANET